MNPSYSATYPFRVTRRDSFLLISYPARRFFFLAFAFYFSVLPLPTSLLNINVVQPATDLVWLLTSDILLTLSWVVIYRSTGEYLTRI